MRDCRSVSIDSVSDCAVSRLDCDAVVLVDVLCDTTTLVTAAAQRRQTFPAGSAPAAMHLARRLRDPILATSEGETWRAGFEMQDSPAALARRTDARPFVLACSTGAMLAMSAGAGWDVYLLCLRNVTATARHLALRHKRVLILDTLTEGDVRCEDQIAAARLGAALAEVGFEPLGLATLETLARWSGAAPSLAAWGRSAEELRRRGRQEDLEFVLSHVDDLDVVCSHVAGQLQTHSAEEPARALPGIA